MPEQQVKFSADVERNINSPSREYGINSIPEVHIPRTEADAPLQQQSTPALSMTAQLDGAVVNRMTEYSGIQQMVRQAVQNASHEAEPEKSFLAKAGVKMGNPPSYSGEYNLEKFEHWVCLTDEAQEWFYQQVEWFDQEIKHWDLESVIMGLQKWFMPTLSLNKVAVNYDNIMQGHIRPNCPFPDKDRRVAGARIEEVILEEDEGQIEESEECTPHPEEQQDWEDQLEEDDQQYHFDDEEYETRSIDEEVVHVNAVIKGSGYNDCHRLYGIRVWEVETDLRVSAAVQTEGKEQPAYDH
ncbi:hypothetical protein M422DRAFT_252861 [Sphaerobolus stellatus SS14]|uniref:Uncharacterized protein n=1 Tax=Sphaerobolus stellatus (strain SS14) TaxID=990650 RepID=A0A0C9VZH7_SPHS4|nr:hypothetical protein M422DRAFT_252861 [Sphaerobolus stellatus SS14]